jgi:hypothetical protein
MTSATSSMIAVKRGACALIVASACMLPSIARADGSRADALFREGRALLDAKKLDEACPKLAEAQKQEPGAGTLLALSMCHEGQGKSATAWAELNQAAVIGKGVGRSDLAAAAQKRAAAMEPTLSKLVIRMPAAAQDADYEVKRDGEPVLASQLGTPVPVDPGEHHVDVSAKGKVSRSYVVRLSGAGVVEIVVDKLEDAPRPAVVPKPEPVHVTTIMPPEPASDSQPGRGQRIVGGSLIVLGVAGIAAGGYFGGRALSERSTGGQQCTPTPKAPCPTDDPNAKAKDSFKMAVTSAAAGTGAVALGAIIYLMAPIARPTAASSTIRRTATITPDVSPTQVSVGLSGAF